MWQGGVIPIVPVEDDKGMNFSNHFLHSVTINLQGVYNCFRVCHSHTVNVH